MTIFLLLPLEIRHQIYRSLRNPTLDPPRRVISLGGMTLSVSLPFQFFSALLPDRQSNSEARDIFHGQDVLRIIVHIDAGIIYLFEDSKPRPMPQGDDCDTLLKYLQSGELELYSLSDKSTSTLELPEKLQNQIRRARDIFLHKLPALYFLEIALIDISGTSQRQVQIPFLELWSKLLDGIVVHCNGFTETLHQNSGTAEAILEQ